MSSPARGQRAATPPPRLADEDVSDHAFAAVAELYCQRVVRTSKTINVDQLPDELQLLNQLSKMNENRKKRNAAWLTLIAYRVLSTKMDDTQLENRVDEVFDALWAYDQLEYLRRQTYISLDRPDIVERLVDLEIIHPTDHSDTIRELRNKLKSADELHYRLERRFESTSLFWRQLVGYLLDVVGQDFDVVWVLIGPIPLLVSVSFSWRTCGKKATNIAPGAMPTESFPKARQRKMPVSG